MNGVIELSTNGKNENRLEILYRKDGKVSKTYTLKTSSPTLRVCQSAGVIKFIDIPEGPRLEVGKPIMEASAVIRSIDCCETFGYTITFE